MADEQDKHTASPRFRLPKFFTQGAEAAAEATLAEVEQVDEQAAPVAAQTALKSTQQKASAKLTNGVTTSVAGLAGTPAAVPAAGTDVAAELMQLRDTLEQLNDQIVQVNERETSLERVFDALHAELADYKNDFLYEHLKPVVRPLLFLFDSLEQFDGEVAMAESTMTQEASGAVLSPPVVRENVRFFRDQLIEALRVCEVTIMDPPQGAFNAKFHKAVDVMPVPSEQDGTVVRVVRSGWFLNGQLLRPAEVVVGKFRG